MCKTTQEVGRQKPKDSCKCGHSTKLGVLRSKFRCENNAEELNMNRQTVRKIVKEDLGMRKISAKMVPRILTHDRKHRRLHISSDLLRNTEMFYRVITGNGTWCFQNERACSVKHRIHLGRRRHACLGRRSRPCLCVSSSTRGQFTMNALHKDKR